MVTEPVSTQVNIQVRIPDNIAAGVYSNSVQMNASKTEVVFDFFLLMPHQGTGILSSRVIVSPETAQQMSDSLESLLRKIKEQKKEEK